MYLILFLQEKKQYNNNLILQRNLLQQGKNLGLANACMRFLFLLLLKSDQLSCNKNKVPVIGNTELRRTDEIRS